MYWETDMLIYFIRPKKDQKHLYLYIQAFQSIISPSQFVNTNKQNGKEFYYVLKFLLRQKTKNTQE